MPLIHVSPTLHSCQVDDFAPGVERSVKGSLHLRPTSTLTITAGELEHIQKRHPKMAVGIQVIDAGVNPPPLASAEPAPAPQDEEEAAS